MLLSYFDGEPNIVADRASELPCFYLSYLKNWRRVILKGWSVPLYTFKNVSVIREDAEVSPNLVRYFESGISQTG